MSSSIVPVSSITASLSTEISGFEGQTIKPSQIRLVQKSSMGAGETLKVGKLVDSLTGQHFDKILAVPLVAKRGRVFFPPDKKVGGTPLCRSNDGIVPSPNVPARQANKCAICDHGPKLWKNYKLTGIKPDCNETVNLLFIDRESGFPYYLTIKGAGIKLFNKMYNDAIFRDILMSRSKGQNLQVYDYTFEITPTRVTGSMGDYYMLNFLNLNKIASPGEYQPLFDLFVKQNEQVFNEEGTESIIDAEVSGVPLEGEYEPA